MSGNENRGKRGGRFHRGGGGRGRGGYRGGFFDRSYNKRPTNMNNYHNQKRTKFEVTQRIKEVDIGVTEFVGDHEHFTGVVKERFNDFQVHEINIDGEMSKLTNQDIPAESEGALDMNELKKNLPQETVAQIESLSKPDTDVQTVEIDVTDMDKDQRRLLHTLGKQIPSIISQTVEKDQKKLLILAKNSKKPFVKFYRDHRPEWNYRDNFCHFVLHKVNMDTMDALNQMAMHLRLKPNSFTYSGTKDRRGRTTQWVCLKRVHPSTILDAGKRVHGAFVGNFKFAKEPLRLGQLKGNHFTIVLRHVTATDEEIEAALTSLRDKGFINYYGLQRFGTVATVPTHHIGRALLQGNWNEAIDLILKPRSGEYIDMAEAREIYAKTKDAAAALKKLRKHDKIEAKLLRGIVSAGANNPQGALDFIPRNARTMYIHAYQSFVWNNMVSRRIREFGNKPIVGDLVYEKADTKEEEAVDDAEQHDESENDVKVEDEKVEDEKVDEKVSENAEEKVEEKVDEKADEKADDKTEDKMEEDTAAKAEDATAEKMETEAATDGQDEKKDEEKKPEKVEEPVERDYHPVPAVKVLTEEDLPNYTLADIVMPQPGWRVVYPTYAKEWYDKFLGDDGLTTDLRQKNQKYSLGGQYRKILQIPKDVSWKVVRYNELKADLLTADIEEMRKQDVTKIDPEGKHRALILDMTLTSSTYATMALREVLKHDTSAETQAAQSAAHHAKDEEERKQEEDKQAAEKNDEEKKEDETIVTEAAEEKMEIAEEAKPEPVVDGTPAEPTATETQ